MTINALAGPVITFQDGGLLNSSSVAQNPDQGPSLFLQSVGLLDPRTNYTYFPGQASGLIGINASGTAIVSAPAFGWLNARFLVADYVPGTASTSSIAPVVALTSTSIPLVTTSTSAVTANSGPGVVTNAAGSTPTTGSVLIDNKPGWVYPSQAQSIGIWDPTNPPVGRAVTVYTNAAASSINFTITGYDAYGYPITQVLAGSTTTGSVTTGKAFKWVSSVVASATASATSVSVGVSDKFGLPMFAGALGYVDLWFNNAPSITTTSTAFVAGTTATTTTSTDVRGTYNIVTGLGTTDGGKTMQIWQSVSVANVQSATGLFGVTPA